MNNSPHDSDKDPRHETMVIDESQIPRQQQSQGVHPVILVVMGILVVIMAIGVFAL